MGALRAIGIVSVVRGARQDDDRMISA